MTRVLFVTHTGASHEPLGLEYLSGALRAAGHETRACSERRAVEEARSWCPDVLALQVLTGDEDRWGNVARLVKAAVPRVRVVAGGPHFFFFRDPIPGVDCLVVGDGERQILSALTGDVAPAAAIEELDSLAPPDRALLYTDEFPGIKGNPIRNFIACRGCPYKCEYCYNSSPAWQEMVKGQPLRYHSPAWICEDVRRTMRLWGGELVSFQDDIFGIDLKWLEQFSRLYRKHPYPFFAQLRPLLITEDRVRLLKEAGVHIISFAVESGNETTREQILDRKESNAVIRRGCDLLHRHGIKFRMQNMLGLPVADPLADALETLRFNIACRPTLSWCSLLQAYPGTGIADYVIKIGLVKSMDELRYLVNATFFDEGSLPIRDKRKIERLHRYWSAVVRWPWLYPLVRAAIEVPLGRRVENAIFERTKTYINAREYWRVGLGRHLTKTEDFSRRPLDRLGGELSRLPTDLGSQCGSV